MGEKIKIPNNHIELVNLIFAQLEITYHNQFHKAFKDEISLNWHFSLKVCVALKGPVRIRVTWKAPIQDLQSFFPR